MTFLQPYVLWMLPLVAVPVIIHLLNRLRHRPRLWAAMSFLLAASRQSRRQAKLRHWLVLACRVLAVTALVFALARPLVGGWLGWAMSGAPDTVMLLLDRSASMELQGLRSQALRRFAEATRTLPASTRLVLVDSATRQAQEISTATLAAPSPLTAATDTGADLPAMLDSAVEYLLANQCGRTEFWIASDLQASNWHPDSPRWPALAGRMVALPQEVRIRVLALTVDTAENMSVRVVDAQRYKAGDHAQLDLTIDLRRRKSGAPVTFPLSVVIEGARSLRNVTLPGQELRFHHRLDLGDRATGGWGWVELPPDANPRDNMSYFAFNPDLHLHAVVAAADAGLGRRLQLATAPAPARMNQSCETVAAGDLGSVPWPETALVVWQGLWPSGEELRRLRSFAEQGGVVVAFPPGTAALREEGRARSEERAVEEGRPRHESPDPGRGNVASRGGSGVGGSARSETVAQSSDEGRGARVEGRWGEAEVAATDKWFRVSSWRDNEGPLARTQEGAQLPVEELEVSRRCLTPVTGAVLATFTDGKPFLVRQPVGKGAVYFCATLPLEGWSNLGEGLVLVPMLQRLMQDGGRRLGSAVALVCGEETMGDAAEVWTRLDKPDAGKWNAGIYRIGNRVAALNRPATEDDADRMEEESVRRLFGAVPLRFFEEQSGAASKLQTEMWRMFWMALLALLLAEAWLTLAPGLARENGRSARGARVAAGTG